MHNCSKLTALLGSALIMGLAGGLAYADAQLEDPPANKASQGQGRSSGAPAPPQSSGVRCKLTKDCAKISPDMVCQKFGDHKECFTPAVRMPVGRPNT